MVGAIPPLPECPAARTPTRPGAFEIDRRVNNQHLTVPGPRGRVPTSARRVLLLVLGTLAPLRKGQGKASCRISFNIKRRDDVINPVPTLAYSEVEDAGSD